MSYKQLHCGKRADIKAYVDDEGKCLAQEFLSKLPENELKAIHFLFRKFAELGMIHDENRFRHEVGPIYEFKHIKGARICCFFLRNDQKKTIVLTHGFKKPTKKVQRKEIERALRIYEEISAHPN